MSKVNRMSNRAGRMIIHYNVSVNPTDVPFDEQSLFRVRSG